MQAPTLDDHKCSRLLRAWPFRTRCLRLRSLRFLDAKNSVFTPFSCVFLWTNHPGLHYPRELWASFKVFFSTLLTLLFFV